MILYLLGLLCLFFFSKNPVKAQPHELVVALHDGETLSYVLSEKPVITFNGNKMLIESSKMMSSEIDLSEVKSFHFEIPNAIADVSENEVSFVRLGTNVQIYGLTEAEKSIQISDMGGRATTAGVSIEGTTANVNLASLPKGIYMIKIGNKQSIKVPR